MLLTATARRRLNRALRMISTNRILSHRSGDGTAAVRLRGTNSDAPITGMQKKYRGMATLYTVRIYLP